MATRIVDVRGRKVRVAEAGKGNPLVYLHGFADVHALTPDLLPFHDRLAAAARVIAPAHPGCATSDELAEGQWTAHDIAFHVLDTLDALGVQKFDLVGHCVGGWIAAEVATLVPERIGHLALIGASGLFVPGAPIADVFMHAQPERGVDYKTLRHLLFARGDAKLALEHYPDIRGEIESEVRRYEMLRFSSFVGFKPPYFYRRALRSQLHRAKMPSAVIWGAHDHFVPPEHAKAYAEGMPGSGGKVITIANAGHSAPLEAADVTAEHVLALLKR